MTNVFPDDPQRTWDEYYHCKQEQRLIEATMMWQQLEDCGVGRNTILALDFCHFGQNRSHTEQLAEQLRENYQIAVTESENDCWLVSGTTRPYGLTMGKDDHTEWVRFMCDVAQSYGCVFSAWTVDIPSLNVKFDSADLESDN